jgi:two-component system KDP operon response regulator KdpE
MKKILLVDDAGALLAVEQMIVAGGGYQLITARDGEAAVRAARAHAPDLILLDPDAPKMEGRDVRERLRETAPVVQVAKPIQGPELLARIKSLLDDGKEHRE